MSTKKTRNEPRNAFKNMTDEQLKEYYSLLLFQQYISELARTSFPHHIAYHAYNLAVATLENVEKACVGRNIDLTGCRDLVMDALLSGATIPEVDASIESALQEVPVVEG